MNRINYTVINIIEVTNPIIFELDVSFLQPFNVKCECGYETIDSPESI